MLRSARTHGDTSAAPPADLGIAQSGCASAVLELHSPQGTPGGVTPEGGGLHRSRIHPPCTRVAHALVPTPALTVSAHPRPHRSTPLPDTGVVRHNAPR